MACRADLASWDLKTLRPTVSLRRVGVGGAQRASTDSAVVFLCSVTGQRHHPAIMCALILLHK